MQLVYINLNTKRKFYVLFGYILKWNILKWTFFIPPKKTPQFFYLYGILVAREAGGKLPTQTTENKTFKSYTAFVPPFS